VHTFATEPPAPMASLPSSQVLALEAAAKAPGGATGSARDASPIQLSLPLDADSGPGAGGPAAGAAGGSGPYSVWLGTFSSRGDAITYWAQEVQRFPDLLKHLRLSVRQVDLGPGQGIWYRVLGGPVADRAAADKLCGTIATRSPSDDCRVFAD
jgi:hypothetical protein